jgi:hypothetical protein
MLVCFVILVTVDVPVANLFSTLLPVKPIRVKDLSLIEVVVVACFFVTQNFSGL